jgi:hypothetical protein
MLLVILTKSGAGGLRKNRVEKGVLLDTLWDFLSNNWKNGAVVIGLILTILTLLFGRGWLSRLVPNQNGRRDEFLIRIVQYNTDVAALHVHALSHQRGEFKTAKESRDNFASLKKVTGKNLALIIEMIRKEKIHTELKCAHLEWSGNLMTDLGLCSRKGETRSSEEFTLMNSSFEQLNTVTAQLKINAVENRMKLKSLK